MVTYGQAFDWILFTHGLTSLRGSGAQARVASITRYIITHACKGTWIIYVTVCGGCGCAVACTRSVELDIDVFSRCAAGATG